MGTLKKFGFLKDWTYETIISCFTQGSPHAAPFGVKTRDFERIVIEIYKGSTTLASVLEHDEFVVNLVDDPGLFYDTLYGKENIKFGSAEKVKAPWLLDAKAHMECRATSIIENEQQFLIEADIVDIHIRNSLPLINRAKGLVMESLILSTKIPQVPEGQVRTLMSEYRRVIQKVAPGSKYESVIQALMDACGFKETA
jgi:hypothetical protein